MLDIRFIREHRDELHTAIKQKRIALDLDELLDADTKRLEVLRAIEKLQEERNKLNDEIGQARAEHERAAVIERGGSVKEKLAALEPVFAETTARFEELMARVPTIPSPDTPIGASDADNREVYRWGDEKKIDFIPKDHIELGKALDIVDFESGVKVGGFRGYFVKNDGVLLMMGIMMYALRKTIERGYAPMIPPTLVKEFALFGSGYFKGLHYDPDVDEVYQIAAYDKEAVEGLSKDKKFLVGTAEPSLLAYYAGETLREEDLPIKLCGYSQCYRSEIGSYGKDVKGMYRVHEFMKVEQVAITKADIPGATKLQDEMTGISGEMHEELGLSYRRVQICTGDMGPGKYRQFDLEAWLPGMNRWAETGSASSFLDWQSRRLNVKYVDQEGNKKYAYMLNNTALPSPRIFIAILEHYQQRDGSVIVPKVLQPYVGKEVISPRHS